MPNSSKSFKLRKLVGKVDAWKAAKNVTYDGFSYISKWVHLTSCMAIINSCNGSSRSNHYILRLKLVQKLPLITAFCYSSGTVIGNPDGKSCPLEIARCVFTRKQWPVWHTRNQGRNQKKIRELKQTTTATATATATLPNKNNSYACAL